MVHLPKETGAMAIFFYAINSSRLLASDLDTYISATLSPSPLLEYSKWSWSS